MNLVIAFVVAVLVFQIALFFVIRSGNKKIKKDNVIEKYNIKSPGDAFSLMNDPNIPQKDREKIELLYNGENES